MINLKQFDIWLLNLNPTIGSEISKTRPCIIISPNEMNWMNTIIVCPLTTKGFQTPTRTKFDFKGVENLALLDQIRTIDKKRLIKIMVYTAGNVLCSNYLTMLLNNNVLLFMQ